MPQLAPARVPAGMDTLAYQLSVFVSSGCAFGNPDTLYHLAIYFTALSFLKVVFTYFGPWQDATIPAQAEASRSLRLDAGGMMYVGQAVMLRHRRLPCM